MEKRLRDSSVKSHEAVSEMLRAGKTHLFLHFVCNLDYKESEMLLF